MLSHITDEDSWNLIATSQLGPKGHEPSVKSINGSGKVTPGIIQIWNYHVG